MKPGNIILTSLTQADGKMKIRPALILKEMPKFHDLLICGVSSKINNHVQGFDEIIRTTDYDFKASGLLQESLIRLGFISVMPLKDIYGSIGKISDERYAKLLTNLINFLKK